jgi:ribonuclease PH
MTAVRSTKFRNSGNKIIKSRWLIGPHKVIVTVATIRDMSAVNRVIREDREDLALRAISVRVGDVNECDGSARWSQGNTSVSVAVYVVPPQALHPQAATTALEEFDAATLLVEITCPSTLASAGSSSNTQRRREKLMCSVVEKVLRAAVDLTSFPNQSIVIKGTVLTDGGSALPAVINCAVLAFLNSGLPMSCTPAATAVAFNDNDRILLDPSADEERTAGGSFLYVCAHSSSGSATDDSEDGGCEPAVLYSVCEGTCSPQLMLQAMDIGKSASAVLLECMRGAVAASHKK